jgi:tetrahydrodipicolinate N-succinyltransferase
LVELSREQHQQQKTTLATFNEALEEMRKEVSEALHRLAQDVDRTAQQSEAQARRTFEQLRNEVLDTLFERDRATVKSHMLGDLLIILGKHLQNSQEESS